MYHEPWRLIQNRVRGKGGRELDRFRGVHPPVDDGTGSEAWVGSVTHTARSTYDEPVGCSKVLLPGGSCEYLFQAIARAPEEILGPAHMRRHGQNLGMLVKLLDAQYPYILQTHPTRPFAKEMWDSDFGKEEAWYVIALREDVPEPPYFILGFKEGITREAFQEAVLRGDSIEALEKLCHKIPVSVGDAAIVGAGVPHALGQGCLVLEVQEPSDITVVPLTQEALIRRWSNNRPMDEALYNRRMLGAFTYEGLSYEENVKRRMAAPRLMRSGAWGSERMVIGPEQTPYFSFSRADIDGCMPLRDTGYPQIALVLSGEGRFHHAGGSLSLSQAEELFLPYDIPEASIEGKLSVMLCHPEGAQ